MSHVAWQGTCYMYVHVHIFAQVHLQVGKEAVEFEWDFAFTDFSFDAGRRSKSFVVNPAWPCLNAFIHDHAHFFGPCPCRRRREYMYMHIDTAIYTRAKT